MLVFQQLFTFSKRAVPLEHSTLRLGSHEKAFRCKHSSLFRRNISDDAKTFYNTGTRWSAPTSLTVAMHLGHGKCLHEVKMIFLLLFL
jgi:hypothetical protein